jgi:hypothetical protein
MNIDKYDRGFIALAAITVFVLLTAVSLLCIMSQDMAGDFFLGSIDLGSAGQLWVTSVGLGIMVVCWVAFKYLAYRKHSVRGN